MVSKPVNFVKGKYENLSCNVLESIEFNSRIFHAWKVLK